MYFDDIPVYGEASFGPAEVSADDVAMFHERFAPYLPGAGDADAPADKRAAAQAHVYALWSRMLAEHTRDWPVLARIGQDQLRWYKTVYAGDALTVRVRFMTADALDDARGVVVTEHEVMNQDGELVMSLLTRAVVARRARAGQS